MLAFAAIAPAAAVAQTTYTWTGGGSDNNWNTAANWSGGVPASSGNTVLVFSGSTRTSPNNNLGDLNLSIGRLQFAAGASAFTLSGNTFGFNAYLGSQTQEIFQNSAVTQTIGVSGFSFRNAADSQINLNAGDLVITSPNVYIDMSSSSGVYRSLYITGTDTTRRTLTIAGNLTKSGSGNDPDIYIQNNKRVLVTGSLSNGTGNDGSIFIDSGVLEFGSTGAMTGGRPVVGGTSGSGTAAVYLNSAGSTFAQQLEIRAGSSGQRVVGGLNTSGTVTYSGDFVATGSPSDYDLKAATGGTVVVSGQRNVAGTLQVNRADGPTSFGGTVEISSTATGGSTATVVNAGTLRVRDVVNNGWGTLRGSVTVNAGAQLDLVGSMNAFGWQTGGSVTSLSLAAGSLLNANTQHIWLQGGTVALTAATMQTNGGVSSPTGQYFEWGNSPITTAADSGTSVIAGRMNLRGDALSGGILNFTVADGAAATDLLVSAAITESSGASGTAGIAKYGAGTMKLTGSNSFTNQSLIYAGTLEVDSLAQLGTNSVEFNAASGDSGTLRYAGATGSSSQNLWIDNTGITRAAIDVSQAGTTLTWTPAGGTVNQNLTKVGAGTLSFGGQITGAATVGVEAGTLLLTASNSYSGGSTVSGGTLQVSASGSSAGGSAAGLGTGPVSIAAGGQVTFWLSTSGSHTIGNAFSLSSGTLYTEDGSNTFSGRVTLASGPSTIAARYEDTITLSGGLSGSGDVLFTQAGGTTLNAAPTYVLSATGSNTGAVRVTGSSVGGATRLQLANVNALQNATLDLATGDQGTVDFTVAGTNTYALGGLQGSRNLAIGANSLSLGGNGSSTTYSGGLSGGGGLVKTGTGTLTLSGSSTYSGGTNLSGGTLVVPGLSSIGTGSLAIGSGATFSYTGSGTETTSRALSLNGPATINVSSTSGALSWTPSSTWTQSFTKTGLGLLSLGGTFSGGAVVEVQSGTLKLTGSNSHTGGTIVSGTGNLTVATAAALGSGTVTLQSMSTAGGNVIDWALLITDTTTITNPIVIVQQGSNRNNIQTLQTGTTVLAGPITITGSGNGINVIGNSTTGSLAITGNITGTSAFTGGMSFRAGQITITGTISMPNANFDLNTGGTTTVVSTGHSWKTTVFQASNNVLRLGADNALPTSALMQISGSTTGGGFDLNGFSQTVAGISMGSTGTPAARIYNNASGTSTLTFAGLTANRSLSAAIADGTGGGRVAVVMNSAGRTQTLASATSSYSGGTTIQSGTLAQGAANALGATTGALAINGGGLDLGGFNLTVGLLTGSAGSAITSGTTGAVTFTASSAADSTFAGTIGDGSGTVAFVKAGAGTLTLSGSSSHTGGTTVSAGRLVGTTASLQGAITNNAAITFDQATNGTYAGAMSGIGSLTKISSGTVTLSGNNSYSGGTIISAGRLVGTTASLQGAITNSAAVTFDQATSGTYAGAMSGGGSLMKSGLGNLILGGSSTFTGPTTVAAGRLSVNGSLGNTAVTVQNGAALGGSGAIAGSLAVLAGGTLAPGNSIESLAVGAITFSGSSAFAYEVDSSLLGSLGTAADLLVVNGDLSIGSGSILSIADLNPSPAPFVNYTTIFALINYSGTWNGGLFTFNGSPLANGDWFKVGGQEWKIDYNRSSATGLDNFTSDYLTGNAFVAITAVPEPSTWALALAGLACGGWALRRRRPSRGDCL